MESRVCAGMHNRQTKRQIVFCLATRYYQGEFDDSKGCLQSGDFINRSKLSQNRSQNPSLIAFTTYESQNLVKFGLFW